MNTKIKTEILLGKMYREMSLTGKEIKGLLKNPIEKIVKCELTEKDERIHYNFYLENDACKYVGEAIL